MDNEFIPVASRDYLNNKGTPQSVFELRQHQGLFYRTPNGPSPWLCEIEGAWHDVSGIPMAVSNNGTWLGGQAVAGLGIMMAPRWSLVDYLESGKVVELFFDPVLRVSQNADLAIYLLYQKQRYLVPKVKVAVDFLVARLKSG